MEGTRRRRETWREARRRAAGNVLTLQLHNMRPIEVSLNLCRDQSSLTPQPAVLGELFAEPESPPG